MLIRNSMGYICMLEQGKTNKRKNTYICVLVALVALLSIIMLIPYVFPVITLKNAWYTEKIQVDGNKMVMRGHTIEPDGYVIKRTSFNYKNGEVTVHVRGVRRTPFQTEKHQTSIDAEYFFEDEVLRVKTTDGIVIWEKEGSG